MHHGEEIGAKRARGPHASLHHAEERFGAHLLALFARREQAGRVARYAGVVALVEGRERLLVAGPEPGDQRVVVDGFGFRAAFRYSHRPSVR